MAVVRFYRTRRISGNTTPVMGHLEFIPTAIHVIAGDPDNTVLPHPFTVALENGQADVDLAGTDASWAWTIKEYIRGDKTVRVRTVAVPSGSVTVDDTDLAVVSPGTLVPVEVNNPAFTVEATTLAAGASATAAITGSYPDLKLSLGIPQGPAGAGAPPATAGAYGSVKLAGDLGGSADAPTVVGLSGKLDSATAATTYAAKSVETSKQDKSALDADMKAKIDDTASQTRGSLSSLFSNKGDVVKGAGTTRQIGAFVEKLK